jgi:hypothetical protein
VVSRNARSMVGWLAGAVVVGGTLLGVYAAQGAQAAQAALGTDPGGVALSPASGSESGTPTWSTNTACPAGFQGSAILRAVKPDGTTFSVSGATNSVTAPFHGTLLGNIAEIQHLDSVGNGSTQELVVICFSGDSLTGTSHPDMDMYITYSAAGTSYTSSGTGTASFTDPTSSATSGTGSGSSSGSGSGSSSSSSSGSRSSSSVTPSPSTTLVTPGSTSSPSSAPQSPSALKSSFAVTG